MATGIDAMRYESNGYNGTSAKDEEWRDKSYYNNLNGNVTRNLKWGGNVEYGGDHDETLGEEAGRKEPRSGVHRSSIALGMLNATKGGDRQKSVAARGWSAVKMAFKKRLTRESEQSSHDDPFMSNFEQYHDTYTVTSKTPLSVSEESYLQSYEAVTALPEDATTGDSVVAVTRCFEINPHIRPGWSVVKSAIKSGDFRQRSERGTERSGLRRVSIAAGKLNTATKELPHVEFYTDGESSVHALPSCDVNKDEVFVVKRNFEYGAGWMKVRKQLGTLKRAGENLRNDDRQRKGLSDPVSCGGVDASCQTENGFDESVLENQAVLVCEKIQGAHRNLLRSIEKDEIEAETTIRSQKDPTSQSVNKQIALVPVIAKVIAVEGPSKKQVRIVQTSGNGRAQQSNLSYV